jgi:predicted RNase H-like HicB family nuclease
LLAESTFLLDIMKNETQYATVAIQFRVTSNMAQRTFTARLSKDTDSEYYAVRCVELPEAISQSKTEEEALTNMDVVEEMYRASVRFAELLETLEVLLDKKTMRRIKLGEKQYKRMQYVVAKGPLEIRRVLST